MPNLIDFEDVLRSSSSKPYFTSALVDHRKWTVLSQVQSLINASFIDRCNWDTGLYLHKCYLDLSHLLLPPLWNVPKNGMGPPHVLLSGGLVCQPGVAETRLWFCHSEVEGSFLNQCLSFKIKSRNEILDSLAGIAQSHSTNNLFYWIDYEQIMPLGYELWPP